MAKKYDELDILEGHGAVEHRYNPITEKWEYVDSYGRTSSDILAEYADRANRLNAVGEVYELTDKIISRDSELTVTVVNDPTMETNAMNDGRNIVFNANLINDFDSENILHLHGLNFHELGHILFSPRAGSDLIRYVKTNGYTRAIALLEEARAENLLIAKYPMTKLFLEASAMEYLVNDKTTDVGNYFPMITGRTYLPIEIRQAVADKFIAKHGAELASVLHNLIHEYRTLVFPRDFDRAKHLIARLAEIIGRDSAPNPDLPIDVHDTILKKGRPQNPTEQARLQDKNANAEVAIENMGDKTDKPMAGTQGDRYEGEDYDLADKKPIADIINERMSEIKNDEYVKQRINEARKAILGQDEATALIDKAKYQDNSPSLSATNIARRFGQELERIVRDSDPNWDKFNARGKLNITRTMNPDVNAIRTHFDMWDTGNPNTDMEAVILMDNSSSMSGLMKQVCESAWTIKRGVEGIQGSVSVFNFNHESEILYDKTEKAKPNTMRYVYACGGTNPIRAMVETERILTMSKKSLKLAFIVTDGAWNMSNECDTIIKSMNDKGFITCVVFIGDFDYYKNLTDNARMEGDVGVNARNDLKDLKHGAQIFHAVATPKDMLNVAQAVVKSALTERKVA